MKNIICYGDSNTWGCIAGTVNMELGVAQRFEYGVRWPTQVQALLGTDFYIVEAGLNGRSTAFDEITVIRSTRNGLTTLPGILEMHYPLDLVILMLGTNDVKVEYNASVEQITEGMRKLVQAVKASHFGPNYQAPKILLISPAPVYKALGAANIKYDETSISKSQQLAKYYAELANQEQCAFLDAGPLVKLSPEDGVHIDRDSQIILAKAVVDKIKNVV